MIRVHNIMEEQVISRVNQLYEQAKEIKSPWLTCDCENCRADTMNFVLNRIPPKYVSGGRGTTHSTQEIGDTQHKADLDSLIFEGMRLVSQMKRPYHNSLKNEPAESNCPAFNFPIFIGSIFDGSSFEPLAGASILLKNEKQIAEMMDISWQNPVNTFEATKGAYSFWIKPLETEKENETRIFHFMLEISKEGYSTINYGFDVPVISSATKNSELNSTYSLKIQDLFLFREDIYNNMDD